MVRFDARSAQAPEPNSVYSHRVIQTLHGISHAHGDGNQLKRSGGRSTPEARVTHLGSLRTDLCTVQGNLAPGESRKGALPCNGD